MFGRILRFSATTKRNFFGNGKGILLKSKGKLFYGTTIPKGGKFVPLGWKFWLSVILPYPTVYLGLKYFAEDESGLTIPEDFRGIYMPAMLRAKLHFAMEKFKKNGSVLEFRDTVKEIQDTLMSWGYDPITPQVTACLLTVSHAFAQRSKELSVSELRDQFQALIKKPHVGEAIIEEGYRIKTAFDFVAALTTADSRFNGEEVEIDPFAWELSEWALNTFQDPPSYLGMRWNIIKSDILAENPRLLDGLVKLLEEK